MRNFATAASFARRLLDLHPKPEISTQVGGRQAARGRAAGRASAPATLAACSARAHRLASSPRGPAGFCCQARKVLQLCEQSPSDAVPLEYDDRNPFVVCNASLTPIYKVRRG